MVTTTTTSKTYHAHIDFGSVIIEMKAYDEEHLRELITIDMQKNPDKYIPDGAWLAHLTEETL